MKSQSEIVLFVMFHNIDKILAKQIFMCVWPIRINEHIIFLSYSKIFSVWQLLKVSAAAVLFDTFILHKLRGRAKFCEPLNHQLERADGYKCCSLANRHHSYFRTQPKNN